MWSPTSAEEVEREMGNPLSTPIPTEKERDLWEGQNAKGGKERSNDGRTVFVREWQKTDVCDREALREASMRCQIESPGDTNKCKAEIEAYKVSYSDDAP